jgi:hypothetical protein
MPFVWTALLPTIVSLLGNSTAPARHRAQRATVQRFAEAEQIHIIAEFVEAESGKGADALDRRPQLAAALAANKTARCCVLVSKLDRLSRDVASCPALWPSASRSSSRNSAGMPIRSCCISTPRLRRRSGA